MPSAVVKSHWLFEWIPASKPPATILLGGRKRRALGEQFSMAVSIVAGIGAHEASTLNLYQAVSGAYLGAAALIQKIRAPTQTQPPPRGSSLVPTLPRVSEGEIHSLRGKSSTNLDEVIEHAEPSMNALDRRISALKKALRLLMLREALRKGFEDTE